MPVDSAVMLHSYTEENQREIANTGFLNVMQVFLTFLFPTGDNTQKAIAEVPSFHL